MGTDCKLNLELSKETINEIFKDLNRKNEVSGILKFNDSGKHKVIDKNIGDAESVATPNHVINFHTHPINAYREADTVWGWPSGEDIRETLKFALSGNKGHMVFSVEGLYTIQVSSCKLKKMKTLLSNEERGILIFLIEEYFKATHNFRCVDEINELCDKDFIIAPESYCNYVNYFDLGSLLSTKKCVHTTFEKIENKYSRLPNNGFLEFGKSLSTLPIKNYISKDSLKDIYKISDSGKELGKVKVKNNSELLEVLKKINKKLGIKKCTTVWNNKENKWFYINFFPSDYYSKKEYYSKNKYINPSKNISVKITNENPYIKIFSNNTEGCTIASIEKIHRFDSVNINSFGTSIYSLISNSNGNITLSEIMKRTKRSKKNVMGYVLSYINKPSTRVS